MNTTGRQPPARVVVVEDSLVQRANLVAVLEADGDIIVIGEAATAPEAIQLVAALRPDVVTLDLNIPGGGGQHALEQIMANSPTPILVLSSTVDDDSSTPAIDALVGGALLALPKPSRWTPTFETELRRHVRTVRDVPVIRHLRGSLRGGRVPGPSATTPSIRSSTHGSCVVAIAASTGGPAALATVLAGLTGLRSPVMVVQHIHPDFVQGLVDWMSRISPLPVAMAQPGQHLRDGCVHIGPGGLHLTVGPDRRIELLQAPEVAHRPSADQLFESVAANVGANSVGVVLTGMGDDGAAGLAEMHRRGAATIAQDEATSAVYGMPRAAARLGVVDQQLGLDEIADGIMRAARSRDIGDPMIVADAADHAIARLLDARIGLRSDDSGRTRLTRALRDLAADRKVDRASLRAALVHDSSLLDDLVDRITVQETSFFRHPDQFERLARVVLPALHASPVLAWSAASANGQEAYSLAIVFAEAGRACSVLASDVSPAALQRTSQGWYGPTEMSGVSAARRHQHFRPDGTGWRVSPTLRDSVVARRHNLLDPIPPHVSACHVVMCRNVLIYLDRPHAESFLDRLADAMDPSAYLFVGGAETLWQITNRFEPTPLGTCYAYRPLSRPRPHAASARPAVVGTVPTRSVSARRMPHPPSSPPHLEVVHPHETGPEDAVVDRQSRGQELLAAGAVTEAIVVLRQWSYECPDDPLAHFQMGVALDRDGDGPSARRAYRAALGALDRSVPGRRAELLEGFSETALRDLLNERSGVEGQGRPVGGMP